MPTLLLTHPACLAHDTSEGYPERADRLRAIERALGQPEFEGLIREVAPRAALDAIERVHPPSYIEAVRARVPLDGYAFLDPDTVVSPGSWEAALRAAGSGIRAVDAVMAGEVGNAFCAIRPPGHHAEPGHAMGFCLFNNAAIAALHARAAHGLERVAVVDFDVHHGNGTQAAFWSDVHAFYGSSHQMPLFPGTGAASETGLGNIVNAPLAPGDGGPAFRAAWQGRILPALEAFQPEIIVVSAGFDAHRDDPLASLKLDESDFAWITIRLVELADAQCEGRLVSMLEGGYALEALARSTAAHVSALMSVH
jgi:acetoin utilization deacetylase AcuC-like enzyme